MLQPFWAFHCASAFGPTWYLPKVSSAQFPFSHVVSYPFAEKRFWSYYQLPLAVNYKRLFFFETQEYINSWGLPSNITLFMLNDFDPSMIFIAFAVTVFCPATQMHTYRFFSTQIMSCLICVKGIMSLFLKVYKGQNYWMIQKKSSICCPFLNRFPHKNIHHWSWWPSISSVINRF